MLHIESPAPALKREKFILDIQGDVPLEVAFKASLEVIGSGRISESRGKTHHCHASTFTFGKDEKLVVAVFPNKDSERFLIYKEGK